jgi:hypothetical protein
MSDPPKASVPASVSGAAPPAGSSPPAPPEDEFAGIRARQGRHPALALAAAALALFIIFHIRHDIAYSLSATEPLDLRDAASTFAPRPAAPPAAAPDQATNRYVRVSGTPDRESALELDTKGSWVFTQFFRILGTGNRLFVHRRENPLPAFRAEEDVFEGRLIRFNDLSFETAIRSYSATHVSATHFFRADDLRRAVAAAPGAPISVRDLAGDPVALGPSDLLAIDLALPEQVRVGFPRDKFRDQAAARAEIEKRGGTVLSVVEARNEAAPSAAGAATALVDPAAPAAPVDRWMLVARFPPERQQAALDELGDLDRKIEIRDARRTFKVRLGDLADGGDALLVKVADGAAAGSQRLPLAGVTAIRTLAAVQIPADAWLLIEGDHPRDHLQTVLFGALLLMFAVVNLIGLARGLKRS